MNLTIEAFEISGLTIECLNRVSGLASAKNLDVLELCRLIVVKAQEFEDEIGGCLTRQLFDQLVLQPALDQLCGKGKDV